MIYFEIKGVLIGLVDKTSEQYANFAAIGGIQDSFNQYVAVFVFLAWIKIFKYISFNKTMTQLQSTLSRCAKDIAGDYFLLFIFIYFLSAFETDWEISQGLKHSIRTGKENGGNSLILKELNHFNILHLCNCLQVFKLSVSE